MGKNFRNRRGPLLEPHPRTSGHVQIIREIYADCDDDTVLFRVKQVGGAACHTGYETCFHKNIDRGGRTTVVGEKIFDPEKVYKK